MLKPAVIRVASSVSTSRALLILNIPPKCLMSRSDPLRWSLLRSVRIVLSCRRSHVFSLPTALSYLSNSCAKVPSALIDNK